MVVMMPAMMVLLLLVMSTVMIMALMMMMSTAKTSSILAHVLATSCPSDGHRQALKTSPGILIFSIMQTLKSLLWSLVLLPPGFEPSSAQLDPEGPSPDLDSSVVRSLHGDINISAYCWNLLFLSQVCHHLCFCGVWASHGHVVKMLIQLCSKVASVLLPRPRYYLQMLRSPIST